MKASPAIPMRVCLLVPMLGSETDGEALGACRAIGRTLASVGLDFHDFAAAIRTSPEPQANPCAYRAGPPPPYRPSHRKVSTFTPAQTAHHRRMALWCRNNERGRLTPREREFIANVASWRRELSIDQADWLTDITDRLEQEDRRAWA